MTFVAPLSRWPRIAPAISLVLIAPLVAEVLPGATRFSALFVFPIEMCVWGGGALLIRYAVRRWQLGWINMLLLALALAVAEECLIQQTSLAPMVLQIKGQVFGRAHGVNYVYLIWALAYETIFVVFLPIYLVELIYPNRREDVWMNRAGVIAAIIFFAVGCVVAWYTWTRIARPNVFHVPVYNPTWEALLTATAVIGALIFVALGPFRRKLARKARPLKPPSPWLLGIAGAIWAILWYGLVMLAFGVAPGFPPLLAVSAALVLTIAILLTLPRWSADLRFQREHAFAIIFGTMLGSMAAGFIGYIGANHIDLYFKIVVNLLAIILMTVLGIRIKRNSVLERAGLVKVDRGRERCPQVTRT